MTEKARVGMYPSYAPVGYRNIAGVDGKRIIVPDPDAASVITELFERFAAGRHSLKALVREFNEEGVKLRGRKLYRSLVHHILRKRVYTGDFDWDGTTYLGTHEPLVTRECWQRVQELLDARAKNKIRRMKHDFAYTGLVHCGHCGCLLVGELKKGKYVYYHCTGNRGKCMEPYTRQEVLTREFGNVLQELVIPQAILEFDAVLTSARPSKRRVRRPSRSCRLATTKSKRALRPCTWTNSTDASARRFSTSILAAGAWSRMVCCARSKTSRRQRRPPSIKPSTCCG